MRGRACLPACLPACLACLACLMSEGDGRAKQASRIVNINTTSVLVLKSNFYVVCLDFFVECFL